MSNIDPTCLLPPPLLLFSSFTYFLLARSHSPSFASSSQQLSMLSFSRQLTITHTHTHTLIRLHCHLFARAFSSSLLDRRKCLCDSTRSNFYWSNSFFGLDWYFTHPAGSLEKTQSEKRSVQRSERQDDREQETKQ